jgi:hypothetical protein
MHCVISVGRRVRACTRLSVAAKALATRDHVRGISGPSTLPNKSDGGKQEVAVEVREEHVLLRSAAFDG